MSVEASQAPMCYDRLLEDDVVETGLPSLLRSELVCALRNGALAAAIVATVLLVEGASLSLFAASTLGAVLLGAALHQAIFAAGTAVQRLRARYRTPETSAA